MTFNRLLRSTSPLLLPVSVEEVRRHLVISDTTQDDYLTSLIEAANDMIDGPRGIGIALTVQTYKMRLDDLASVFTIPIYPVRSVTKIEWIDQDNTPVSSTDFHLDNITTPARVHSRATGSPQPGTVSVTFEVGHETLPSDLRHALLMIVGHLYENREATTTVKLEEVPMAVNSILNRYRV